MSVDVLTVSSKGQVVLPAEVRRKMSISAGDKLASYVTDDMIVLKRIELPTFEQFRAQLDEAKSWAASVGYTEEDVNDIVKSVRKKKRA